MASITPLASGRGLPDLSVVEFAIMIALLRLAVYIMIGALILQAVLSWVNP